MDPLEGPLDFTQTPDMAVAAFEWRPEVVGLDSCEHLEMVQLYTWDGSGFRWLGPASPVLDLLVNADGAGDESTLDGLEGAQRLRSLNIGQLSGLHDVDRLTGLHDLRTLVLAWREGAPRQFLDLSFLQGLSGLRELLVQGTVDVASLTFWTRWSLSDASCCEEFGSATAARFRTRASKSCEPTSSPGSGSALVLTRR